MSSPIIDVQAKAPEGQADSKTFAAREPSKSRASVLDCGCPSAALWIGASLTTDLLGIVPLLTKSARRTGALQKLRSSKSLPARGIRPYFLASPRNPS